MVLLEVPQCQFVIFKGIRLQVANNMKIPVSVLIAISLLQAGELGAIQQLSPGNRHRNRPMAGGRIQSRFPRIQAVDELNRTLQVAQILNQAIVTLDILSRSEERRVGKECRPRGAADRYKDKEHT